MTICTCWVEEAHLRDIAELLTTNDYHATLDPPNEERSWQLTVSGGNRVPYWEQELDWIIRCRQVDDSELWRYSYDDDELIGDTTDKPNVFTRIRTRIHGID
jgi:hypothetical protein